MVGCCGCCGDARIIDASNFGFADNETTGLSESSVNFGIKYQLDTNENKIQRRIIATDHTQDLTSGRKNRFSACETFGMPNADLIWHEARTSGPYLICRKKKCFYNVRFPSRPLHIKLTSSSRSNKNGYIIDVGNKCPVSDAQEVITLKSKVIYINGKLVEGCNCSEISSCVRSATLPIRLTLVGPQHLSYDEKADDTPEVIEIL